MIADETRGIGLGVLLAGVVAGLTKIALKIVAPGELVLAAQERKENTLIAHLTSENTALKNELAALREVVLRLQIRVTQLEARGPGA